MCFRPALLLAAALTTCALPSLAQEETDLSRQAIEEAIREAEPEASAFAAQVAARAEAFAAEAEALTESVFEAQTAAPPQGLDTILGDGVSAVPVAEARTSEPGTAGVMVFASLSMPEPALKRLVRAAHQAEVPVMLRGFIGESLGDTARALHERLGDEAEGGELLAGVLIDPRAFRIFDVQEVPVFLATAHALPDCDGLNCSAPPPANDRIAGNMSLKAALEALAQEGDAAPLQSAAALARLEARP